MAKSARQSELESRARTEAADRRYLEGELRRTQAELAQVEADRADEVCGGGLKAF